MTPLRALLAPVRVRLLAGLGCQAGAAIAGTAPFVAVAELCRRLLDGTPMSALWPLVAVALVALPLRAALLVAASTLTHFADNDLQVSLRRRLARHLTRLPLGWFAAHDSGRVKRAVSDDVGALHHLVAHALLDLTTAVVAPLATAAYLATLDPVLSLVTVVPLGVGLALHRRAMRDVHARMREYQAATAALGSAVVEFFDGIAEVKAFGQAGRAHRRFTEAAERYGAFVAGWARSVTPAMAWSQFALSPVAVLGILLLAGVLLSPAATIPFVIVGAGLSAPLLAVGYSIQDTRAGQAAAGDIAELLATPELPDSGEATVDGARLEFASVRFSYDGETEVLHGIDLTLEPGTVTALVGPSGSGKSTIAALAARFHDVTGGAVRLGGTDLRDLPVAQLYRHVGFVLQDVRVLRTSVADNLRLGRPGAPLADVHAAARAARVHERFLALPRGYDTVLGEEATLSTGEAQRLSIARALLADTPVLILDEATASVDPESEAAIQEALSALVAGRTTLVIAHRLATVTEVDRIVVLDRGRITECGTHGELVAAGGGYARMWACAA
ncbi:ABC transporter ATP-binding protein [Amycolatopsis tolypomycina]|uniref:ABC transporter ATP-binding protein n=1 Tax=Amycolatopsis tolypomycina TaxID=208445 RepID=UPI0033A0017F